MKESKEKKMKNNLINYWKNNRLAIVIILASILVFCIVIAVTYSLIKPPNISSEYTGKYIAEVYKNGKYDKAISNNSVLILNYDDAKASLVIDGAATNEQWSVTKDGCIKVGKKKLTKIDEHTLSYEHNDIKVIFKQETLENVDKLEKAASTNSEESSNGKTKGEK